SQPAVTIAYARGTTARYRIHPGSYVRPNPAIMKSGGAPPQPAAAPTPDQGATRTSKPPSCYTSAPRERGGIGRRAGFRFQWTKVRGGSSPPARTSNSRSFHEFQFRRRVNCHAFATAHRLPRRLQ